MFFTYVTRIGLAVITFGMGSAIAMSSAQPTSSSALSSTGVSAIAAAPDNQIAVITRQTVEKQSDASKAPRTALKYKPLATWTADDLIQWLNGDAQEWNPESPLLSWFGLDLIQEQIRYIFNRHRCWYQNNDTFTAFLKASNFLDFLSLNKHDDIAVSNELFSYLQEYVKQAAPQPTISSCKNSKECKVAAITHAQSDEPSLDDDREVQAIMRRKPVTKVRTLEQMLEIQQRALQETHDCSTWLAWKGKGSVAVPPPQRRTRHFKSITFRRL